MQSTRTCTFPECSKPYVSRGYCHGHYDQLITGREIKPLRQRAAPGTPIRERIDMRTDKTGSCWTWTGALSAGGYGVIKAGPGRTLVHRMVFELERGPIPDGKFIDHMCHNRSCIRLEHLQVATVAENNENRSGATVKSSTGVRGVTWDPRANKYRVSAGKKGRAYYGGSFATIEEAERAAIALRNTLFTNNLRDRAQESKDAA